MVYWAQQSVFTYALYTRALYLPLWFFLGVLIFGVEFGGIVFIQAWNVYGVLNYLQALVEKSMIIQILEQEKEGLEQFTATDGYDYNGGSNVLKVLGYFSMVGLLRVHCLLGDYHTGLKCLLPIDITQQGVYTSVIGSHITTIYHYGFASLMLRRYDIPVYCALDLQLLLIELSARMI